MKKQLLNRAMPVIAAPALALAALLLTFFLLSQSTVGIAHEKPASVTNVQSLDASFATSGTVFATDGTASANNLYVCSEAWVTETVDSAGNVGADNSLALAPTYPYTPYISYRNITTTGVSYTLKYAQLGGTTWLSETVDSGGQRSSLALVPTYPFSPAVLHHNWEEGNLRYACRNGMTWTLYLMSSLGPRAGSLALEPTYPYTPHVSYFVTWGTIGTLRHAYLKGTTWCSGHWVKEYVEPPLSGAGRRSSLALESVYPYTPHISYHGPDSDLKHAWKVGTTWFSETVDSAGDVGDFSSLALDSTDNPHIAYYDATNIALKYAWLSGTLWLSETVGSVAEPNWRWRPISLDLDQADIPYISYYNTNGNLALAHLSGSIWLTQTVDSIEEGQYTSLVLDPVGCPHISYYDATNGDLKYAHIAARPYGIYLPLVLRQFP